MSDKCQWKRATKSGVVVPGFYESSNHFGKVLFVRDFGKLDYTHCPYCGKEIEVTGD